MLEPKRMLAGDLIEIEESGAGDAHLEPFLAWLAGRVGHVPGRVEDGDGARLEPAELVGGEREGARIAEHRARREAARRAGEGAEGGAGREQGAGEHAGGRVAAASGWWLGDRCGRV